MRKKLWGGYTPTRFTAGISKTAALFGGLWLVLMGAAAWAVSSNGQFSILLSRLGW